MILNLTATLSLHASTRASHPAIVEGERVITYGELDTEVDRTTGHLGDLGLANGDLLGICLRDHSDHVILLLAAARLGIAVLPMDWHWTRAERQRIVDVFQPGAVLIETGADTLEGVANHRRDTAWHDAVTAASASTSRIDGSDTQLVLALSSGTTAAPKGPMITHDNMLARFRGHWISLGFNQHDRFTLATPLYYGGGRGFVLSYLYIGATVHLFPPPFKPDALVAEVERRAINALFLVPTQIRRLLAIARSDGLLFPGVDRLVSSGASLSPEERKAVRQKLAPNFIDYYSSTEGGGITVQPALDQDLHPGSVGRPSFMTEVETVDEDHNRLPVGETGRIRYRGPGVATGFFKNQEPGSTDGSFFRNGWFYPGDIGEMNDDGYLFLRGRARDVIIRGGANIYPSDIELALQAHPAVEEAAVVGWPSSEYGEEVAAFVIADGTITASALIAHCRHNLSRHKVPREVHIVEQLPRNSIGKVLKNDLVRRLHPL